MDIELLEIIGGIMLISVAAFLVYMFIGLCFDVKEIKQNTLKGRVFPVELF